MEYDLKTAGGTITVNASAPVKNARIVIPRAIRKTLEKSFTYWLDHFAPHHFERKAFYRYSEQYANHWKKNYRGYARTRRAASLYYRIKKGVETDKPLVATGALRSAILHGSYAITGSNTHLTVSWTDLPVYLYKWSARSDSGHFDKQAAISEVTSPELTSLFNFFEKELDKQITSKFGPRQRSYGKAVL